MSCWPWPPEKGGLTRVSLCLVHVPLGSPASFQPLCGPPRPPHPANHGTQTSSRHECGRDDLCLWCPFLALMAFSCPGLVHEGATPPHMGMPMS